MPDATEWLVESTDSETVEPRYEHIATREDAIEYLRQLVGQGKTATLYQRIPFTVQVDVTVKAPRKRKKKESIAEAASPQAAEAEPPGSRESAPSSVATAGPVPVSLLSTIPTGKEEESPKEGAERRPAPSPVCEASWPGDPACPGPAEADPATGGAFCGFHLTLVPESLRIEMHCLHKDRNAPVVRTEMRRW